MWLQNVWQAALAVVLTSFGNISSHKASTVIGANVGLVSALHLQGGCTVVGATPSYSLALITDSSTSRTSTSAPYGSCFLSVNRLLIFSTFVLPPLWASTCSVRQSHILSVTNQWSVTAVLLLQYNCWCSFFFFNQGIGHHLSDTTPGTPDGVGCCVWTGTELQDSLLKVRDASWSSHISEGNMYQARHVLYVRNLYCFLIVHMFCQSL